MELNQRQKAFVRGVTQELKPASVAYADAYGGDPADNSTQVKASQLLRNPKIERTLEEIENNMSLEAAQAFESYVELAKDHKTPAAVKEKIYAKIMALGGLLETQKVDTKNTVVYPGLNDQNSLDELLKGIGYKKVDASTA